MRVTMHVNDEMSVDVDPREVIAELMNDYDRPETVRAAEGLINRSYVCLKIVPDELIAQMSEKVRGIVANGLREQAARYESCAAEAGAEGEKYDERS